VNSVAFVAAATRGSDCVAVSNSKVYVLDLLDG